jgi:N-sulfoglucosamine sulfohydrolase
MKYNKLISCCLLGTSAISLTSCTRKVPRQPNFIFIIADDVSWDDIGCYGNKQVKTTNIDRLASNGIMFENFFLTASSSSPSRNSIITGRYPHNTGGAELHSLPPDSMMAFTEVLRQNGYYTAQAGKFHMGNYARRGFDQINENGKINGDGGEELWIKLLQDRSPEKPFFMWFASYDAHRPWGPNDMSGTHNPSVTIPPFYLPSGDSTKKDLSKYYDEITRLDKYVGLIVEELGRQKIIKNTIIIFMADNGRPFPHSKTWVNDRGLKTPFIVYWPEGIGLKNKKCKALVSSIDIAPTILELANADIPQSFQGHSFIKLLNNPYTEFRNYLFGEHNWHDYEAHERMVRTKEYLYILNSRPQFPNLGPADVLSGDTYKEMIAMRDRGSLTTEQAGIFILPRPVEELYDNKADPDQLLNISSVPGHLETLIQLRQILEEWMKETGDNIPESITKDWYLREPGNKRTENFNIRGEPVDQKFNATQNNNKGRF